ncbi:hypothetical protein EP227_04000 [bacterium]|nr:MAG: hypothetical protein EP227_04000 [bacterium]
MSKTKKIGIIIILIGLCLPTATLPFISEFRPLPNVCLTSNFFGNLGNMVIAFGQESSSSSDLTTNTPYKAAIPYRYIFATGVILTLSGVGVILLSGGNKRQP